MCNNDFIMPSAGTAVTQCSAHVRTRTRKLKFRVAHTSRTYNARVHTCVSERTIKRRSPVRRRLLLLLLCNMKKIMIALAAAAAVTFEYIRYTCIISTAHLVSAEIPRVPERNKKIINSVIIIIFNFLLFIFVFFPRSICACIDVLLFAAKCCTCTRATTTYGRNVKKKKKIHCRKLDVKKKKKRYRE